MREGKSDYQSSASSWTQKKSTRDLMALNLLEPRKGEELQSLWIHLLIKFWWIIYFFLIILHLEGDLLAHLNFLFWDRSSFWHRPWSQLCRVAGWWGKKSWLRAVLKTPVAKAHLPWHWQSSFPGWFPPQLLSLSFTPARSRRSPLLALPCLPQAPHGYQRSCFCLGCPRREGEGEKGAGKERRQIRCLLAPTFPLASSATPGLCSALTERQRLAAHPAVRALSLLTAYSNKQG